MSWPIREAFNRLMFNHAKRSTVPYWDCPFCLAWWFMEVARR